MDQLTLNQEFNTLNSRLNLYSRRESGLFESIANLIRDALPNEIQNPEGLALLTESLTLKLMSSPLHGHIGSLCNLM